MNDALSTAQNFYACLGRGHPGGQGQLQGDGGEDFQGLGQTGQGPGKVGIRRDKSPPFPGAAALDRFEINRLNSPVPEGRGQPRRHPGFAHVGIGAGDKDPPEGGERRQ